jgi:hypothetical protein
MVFFELLNTNRCLFFAEYLVDSTGENHGNKAIKRQQKYEWRTAVYTKLIHRSTYLFEKH